MTVSHVHLDGVPLPVLLPAVVVTDVVLLAQFVRQPLRGVAQIAEAADDFRAAAGVVGNRAQRIFVHVLVAGTAPAAAASRREADLGGGGKREPWPAAPAARNRNREPRTARLPRLRRV